MRETGVRELKQSLGETLRAVGRGEQVRVTLRGRPLVDIVPTAAATADERLRDLVAAGRLVPPSSSRPTQAPKPAAAPQSASERVLSERDARR